MASKAIGIDLGTTYSCVAVWRNNQVEVIVNDQGNRTTPSCVAFTHTQRFIGDAAFNQAASNPTNTIFEWLEANEKAEQEDYEHYQKILASVFVPAISNMPEDMNIAATSKKKYRWLKGLAKYGLKFVIDGASIAILGIPITPVIDLIDML